MILHFTITQKTKTLYYLETTSLNIGNSISLNNQTTQSTNHKIPQYFSQYCYQSIKKKPIRFTPSSFFNFILLPKSKNNFSVKFQPFAKLPTSKNSNDEIYSSSIIHISTSPRNKKNIQLMLDHDPSN